MFMLEEVKGAAPCYCDPYLRGPHMTDLLKTISTLSLAEHDNFFSADVKSLSGTGEKVHHSWQWVMVFAFCLLPSFAYSYMHRMLTTEE